MSSGFFDGSFVAFLLYTLWIFILISFIFVGVVAGLTALCYAEVASTIPVSGSAYSYSYASLGEFVAWIMGVLLLYMRRHKRKERVHGAPFLEAPFVDIDGAW